jgi:selenophosphate synthetase-related protein
MTEKISINSVIDVKDFLRDIENLVVQKKMEYIEAVVYYCEKNGMEVETAGQLIKQNQKFKAKIRGEAEDLHFLPRTSKLPI